MSFNFLFKGGSIIFPLKNSVFLYVCVCVCVGGGGGGGGGGEGGKWQYACRVHAHITCKW